MFHGVDTTMDRRWNNKEEGAHAPLQREDIPDRVLQEWICCFSFLSKSICIEMQHRANSAWLSPSKLLPRSYHTASRPFLSRR